MLIGDSMISSLNGTEDQQKPAAYQVSNLINIIIIYSVFTFLPGPFYCETYSVLTSVVNSQKEKKKTIRCETCTLKI